MKWLALVLLAGACSESGAHFTLSAPNGPTSASSFKVILATPDPIPNIADQRINAGSPEVQTVPYYLQRTIAGASDSSIDMVDGLRIKIEADATLTDATYIPFVLLYDDAGAIVGIGTFHAEGKTEPSPVIVRPDEIDKYVLDVEPVTVVDDMTHAVPGQLMPVDCFDDRQNASPSGFAWRPASGGELRLLYPMDGGLDATGRELDLDCDGHAVTAESSGLDCDDARAWFHQGALETCDGYDTNCDGARATVVSCPANTNVCTNPTTTSGIALCDDMTGTTGTCMSDPNCACAAGTACARCTLTYAAGTTPSEIAPCQPGVGTLTAGCTSIATCTVEVIAVHGGWKVEVADTVQGTFGLKATNIGQKFSVRIKRPEGPGVEITGPGAGGGPVGEVDFMITPPNGAPRLFPIEIGVGDNPVSACMGSGGMYPMSCVP